MSKKYLGIIRKLVRSTGLSILDTAIEINASEKSIYKWLKGTSSPNCEHLLELLSLIEKKNENHLSKGL